MKFYVAAGVAVMVLWAGCATKAEPRKVVVLETRDITKAHEVLGPVSVSEQIAESMEDTVKGLAGYVSRDERVSGVIPADTQAALDAKTQQYKEMIFEKLGAKARSSDADAVIGAEYHYAPAYVTLSSKATVSAKGTMIKYKN
ncbi:MAG: hypothetical protein BWY42_00646 [Candidatus Omnitrophica bacterium ADurb.Bin277]|nr:MAG: hypothetical protein BWY42_00646 [Candidatus Omnitrophica bacterium ADurb.Bin277]